jgi:hypothetical protein
MPKWPQKNSDETKHPMFATHAEFRSWWPKRSEMGFRDFGPGIGMAGGLQRMPMTPPTVIYTRRWIDREEHTPYNAGRAHRFTKQAWIYSHGQDRTGTALRVTREDS